MSKIVILDENTANQIAAGEVIERPASVVKEMVENSIDAGASQITVEIRNGGISYIRITDNGSGMEEDDVEIAFERHATSKMRRIEDLEGLSTMGFRGEALASVASVSQLEITTKVADAASGITLKMEGGRVISASQTGCPTGTTFIVKKLFYNTPARYKFLKKDTTEAGYVSDIIERLAMAHPEISFKFIRDNKIQLHTPGNDDLLSVIYSIYGKEIAKSVLPVNYENEEFNLSGYIGRPEISRGTRGRQTFFLNGRYIKSHIVANALEEAYKTLLMQNKFPFCVLLLTASPGAYDVNVHPQKLEVRFANESALYSTIYHGVKNTLLGTNLIRNFQSPEVFEPGIKSEPVIKSENDSDKQVSPNKPNTQNAPDASYAPNTPRALNIPNANIPKLNPGAAAQHIHNAVDIQETEEFPSIQTSIFESTIDNSVKPGQISDQTRKENSACESGNNHYDITSASKRDSLQQLLAASIVGQAFDTYIIFQNGDNLFMIDQHAAHERIRYENLKNRLSKGESFAQVVMEPYIIKLSIREFNFVMDQQDSFRQLGFDLEPFGSDTVILRSIPDFYDSNFTIGDFQEILDRWIQTNAKDRVCDDTLYMMSCKGAIKANRLLSREEIRNLVESLCSMENPYTCVHGRPIIITISKTEIEKKFKRIV